MTEWLERRGIKQWRPGVFQTSVDYFSESIRLKEVFFVFVEDELAGTLRLLQQDPIVWPEIDQDDALYIYNLAVRPAWTGKRLGCRLLDWAGEEVVSRGRTCLRLDCFADNDFLIDYYAQAGFINRGVVDATYPDPIGTLRLRRFEKQVTAGGKG